MEYPEGLRTVRWDKEGINIIERDEWLMHYLKYYGKQSQDNARLLNTMKPLDLEDWLVDNYNVMA